MYKKKCAILTTIDASMSWFMLPYAYALKKRDVDVTLICNMTESFQRKNSKDFKCISINLSRGFHCVETICVLIQLIKLFMKERFDMIEYATENVSLSASIAGWICGVPVRVYDEWGILFEGYSGLKRFIVKKLEKCIALFSTHLRQVSEKNKELGVTNKLYKAEKVVVLGKGGTIGVDLARFNFENKTVWNNSIRSTYKIPNGAIVLGFVGRIQRDKGVNELIQAYRALYEQNTNMYLMLVGFVDTANPINDENMSWASICDNVIFTGRVDDTEKYIASFDMLVHPTYREGFGMVLQEAGAMKTPIVTTNVIGPSEFIVDGWNGVLVEKGNTESLYLGIKRNLDDPVKMTTMAENCYQFTKQFFERKTMIDRMVSDRMSLLTQKDNKF